MSRGKSASEKLPQSRRTLPTTSQKPQVAETESSMDEQVIVLSFEGAGGGCVCVWGGGLGCVCVCVWGGGGLKRKYSIVQGENKPTWNIIISL